VKIYENKKKIVSFFQDNPLNSHMT